MSEQPINKIYGDETVSVYLAEDFGSKEEKAKLKERMLGEILQVDASEIFKNEYGKPYIKGRDTYFSFSHDEGMTVLAVSDKEIGIDIEKIVDVKWPVINRLFPCDYKAKIEELEKQGSDCEAAKREFIKVWTSIEAVLKARGTGFYKNGFDVRDFMADYNIRQIDCSLCPEFIISYAMHK